MSTPKGLIAAAVLVAALSLSACGDDEPEPSIPLADAQTLIATLQEIQANVDAGSCLVAADKVDELRSEIDGLPSGVEDDLRRGLENGADRLSILVNDPDQCERPEEEPETTTEETEEPEPTTEETEPTTTQETQPTTPTTPGGGGGTGGLGPGGGGQ